LQICEEYGREFSVAFNAGKSASLFVGRRTTRVMYIVEELIVLLKEFSFGLTASQLQL